MSYMLRRFGVSLSRRVEKTAQIQRLIPRRPQCSSAQKIEQTKEFLENASQTGNVRIKDVLEVFNELLEQDPRVWHSMLKNFDRESKRKLFEVFEENRSVVLKSMRRSVQVLEQKDRLMGPTNVAIFEGAIPFESIDKNKDGVISKDEFYDYLAQRYEEANAKPTIKQLLHLAVINGIPFIGFGFLDNAIMIGAGEYIDSTIGMTLGISTMAAAAMGNLVSDIAGVGMGGTIEAFAEKLGIPPSSLSLAQQRMKSVSWAKALGAAIGVSIGCIIGMFPLLFFENDRGDEATKDSDSSENTV